MPQGSPEPTHRPKSDVEFEPRGYVLSAKFHPEINLAKGGYAFAAAIVDYLEARTVTIDQNQWVFSQPTSGSSKGLVQLVITPNSILFEVSFPTQKREWVANRFKMVLEVFVDTFKPKIALDTSAKVVGTMQVDGDARKFLLNHVAAVPPERLNLLNRPVHLFGIRLFCPPFERHATAIKKGKRKSTTAKEMIPWHVDVKAESLIDDPSKLYLEADATWIMPGAWDQPKIVEIVSHLETLGKYLEEDVIRFLQTLSDQSGDKQ